MTSEKSWEGRDMWVGLGNPGPEYENTYHNVGRMALAYFLSDCCTFQAEPGHRFEYVREDERIYVQTLSYMNESGAPVAAALRYFRRTPRSLLVFQDDSDLPFGEFKISCGSGAAGHHGVESLIKNLKTKDFCRVRIGIRPKAQGQVRQKASEFVLRKLSAADKKGLQRTLGEIEKLIVKEKP